MIKFIESTHQYLSDKGELTSVSVFMDSFKEKVDWKAVAKRVALKETKQGTPATAEDILVRWDRKRDYAAAIGTMLHSIKENEIIDSEPVLYGKSCRKGLPCYSEGVKLSSSINQLENDTVYPEMMIYDLEHMICGQSDKVIVINNHIHIWDYKTDDTIKFKGYSNQWQSAKRYKKPISHLEECSANTYSLKMSLYMYMLWKANKGRFLPGDIIIEHVHLKRVDGYPVLENGVPVVLKIEQIKLPYRKKEVEAMLKTLKPKV